MPAPLPTVEVSRGPAPPVEQQHGPRWWMLAVALATIAALALTLFFVLGGEEPTDDGTQVPPDGDSAEPAEPEIRYEEEPPANWDVTGVAAGDVLNVRTGPGVAFPVTATLATDTVELESSGRIAYVHGVLWREIKVPGATTGWVHAGYLTEHQPPAAVRDIGIGLPAPAMTTAREIFIQAQRGELAALAGLAFAGETRFTASFGDEVATPEQLVSLWDEIGRAEVLGALTALVQLPGWFETAATDSAGAEVAIYVTPRFMHEPTAANRRGLEQRLGVAEVERWIADGQWLGWRLGITAEGDWQFFVIGD